MIQMNSRARLYVWLGTMGAARLAAVGFAEWSPPPAAPPRVFNPPGGAAAVAPTEETTAPPAAARNSGETTDEPFVNPEQVARQFCRQLAALVKEGDVVAARELARQIARETACRKAAGLQRGDGSAHVRGVQA